MVSSGKVSQSTEGLCLQDEGSEGSKVKKEASLSVTRGH